MLSESESKRANFTHKNKMQKFTPHKHLLDKKRTAKTLKSIAATFND